MATIFADRIRETTTVVGTGPATLLGAVAGFRAFSVAMADGDDCEYCIVNGAEWEVGSGLYVIADNTLSRVYGIYSSSNADSLVDFSAGTKEIFLTLSVNTFNHMVNSIGAVTDGVNTLSANKVGSDPTGPGMTANTVRNVAVVTQELYDTMYAAQSFFIRWDTMYVIVGTGDQSNVVTKILIGEPPPVPVDMDTTIEWTADDEVVYADMDSS